MTDKEIKEALSALDVDDDERSINIAEVGCDCMVCLHDGVIVWYAYMVLKYSLPTWRFSMVFLYGITVWYAYMAV